MKVGIAIVLTALTVSCTPRSVEQSNDPRKPISEVLSTHTPDWLRIQGVIGSGETMVDGDTAIMIFVDTVTDELRTKLPKRVDGYPVVIEQSGKVVPLH